VRDQLLALLAAGPPELGLLEEAEVRELRRLPIYRNLAGDFISLEEQGGRAAGEEEGAAAAARALPRTRCRHRRLLHSP
jgi:hypothetical protein